MSKIKEKICMLGASAVGKTSLVRRFVKGIFSDKYLTTIGVKIDKKTVTVGTRKVDLVLWDIHGEDELKKVRTSYLKGASGYFLVVDGTRADTLDTALILQKKAEETMGKVPFILVFNKSDLKDKWEIDKKTIEELSKDGLMVVETSAKTGRGVEETFLALTVKMLEG
jgi:small GTP-binding protein